MNMNQKLAQTEQDVARLPLPELQRAYDELAAKCAGFDLETVAQRRKLKDGMIAWEANRKQERELFLQMKLIVSRRLFPLKDQAEKTAKQQQEQAVAKAEADRVAAEQAANEQKLARVNERLNAERENKLAEQAAEADRLKRLLADPPSADPTEQAELDRLEAQRNADARAAAQAEADRLAAEEAARKQADEQARAAQAEADRQAAAARTGGGNRSGGRQR